MLLLDTHAYIWLASDQSQLSPTGLEAITRSAGQLYMSSISALETALLVNRGRLELPCTPEDYYQRAISQHGIAEIAIDHAVAFQSTKLPDIHNDPFDRIIIATAIIRGLHILSKDRLLPKYPGIEVIW